MAANKAIKWSVIRAAAEFGIDRKTLGDRLKRAGIEPIYGASGYSTQQICAAVYGDLAGEKLRNEKYRADMAEIELARMRGELIPWSFGTSVLADLITAITQKIKGTHLSNTEKAEILRDIQTQDIHGIIRKRAKEFQGGD